MNKTYKVTPQQIAEMRDWINECLWRDVEDADELTEEEVIRGIERHYSGGVDWFIKDGETA